MGELGVRAGDRIEIASDYAQIEGIVEPDATLRRGVVSMSHCFGGLPDEEQGAGSCTNLLVDARRHRQAINAMPTMSGLPVRVVPCPEDGVELSSPGDPPAISLPTG